MTWWDNSGQGPLINFNGLFCGGGSGGAIKAFLNYLFLKKKRVKTNGGGCIGLYKAIITKLMMIIMMAT